MGQHAVPPGVCPGFQGSVHPGGTSRSLRRPEEKGVAPGGRSPVGLPGASASWGHTGLLGADSALLRVTTVTLAEPAALTTERRPLRHPALTGGARVLPTPEDTLLGPAMTRGDPTGEETEAQAFARGHVGGERWDPVEHRVPITGHLSSCGPCRGRGGPGKARTVQQEAERRVSGCTPWPTRALGGPAPALLCHARRPAWRPPGSRSAGAGFLLGR